jgi:glycine cleavage system aminomethyltransferase T
LVKPSLLCYELAHIAGERGVVFHTDTPVTGIDVARGRVQAVVTERGKLPPRSSSRRLASGDRLDGGRSPGSVTSAGYGYSVGKSIVCGYLPVDYTREGTRFQVYFFGARHDATVANEPLYDPQNLRLRG